MDRVEHVVSQIAKINAEVDRIGMEIKEFYKKHDEQEEEGKTEQARKNRSCEDKEELISQRGRVQDKLQAEGSTPEARNAAFDKCNIRSVVWRDTDIRGLELGCSLGLKMKRGLTAKGLRQAEVEYYLWGGCSLFPFVQVITDMETEEAAFYKTGSSVSGHNIVEHYIRGMESLKEFVKDIVLRISDDAGKDGPGGMMKIPRQFQDPTRKRRREDTSEPDAGGISKRQQLIAGYERGILS